MTKRAILVPRADEFWSVEANELIGLDPEQLRVRRAGERLEGGRFRTGCEPYGDGLRSSRAPTWNGSASAVRMRDASSAAP